MRIAELAGLTIRIVGGVDGQGGGTGPVVVLMHGFGAPGDDLVSLSKMLKLPREVRFVFPEAPLPLPPSMGGFGRMWWPIDLERLERAMATGEPRDMRDEDPPGMAEARGRIVALLGAIRTVFGVRSDEIVLGGFSQGSMLACDVLFRTSQELAGLVILSGTLLAREAWTQGMTQRVGLPVFQSHGTHDMLLPFGIATELSKELEARGLATTFTPFRGGHDIPPPVLAALEAFLRRTLPLEPSD